MLEPADKEVDDKILDLDLVLVHFHCIKFCSGEGLERNIGTIRAASKIDNSITFQGVILQRIHFLPITLTKHSFLFPSLLFY